MPQSISRVANLSLRANLAPAGVAAIPMGPLIERPAQVAFEIAGGAAERRRRHVEGPRGLGERAVLDDGDQASILRARDAARHHRGIGGGHPELDQRLLDLHEQPLDPPVEDGAEPLR